MSDKITRPQADIVQSLPFRYKWARAGTAEKTFTVFISGTALLTLFTFCIGQFFQIRGVQHMMTSRVFLIGAWLILVSAVWGYAWVRWYEYRWRITIVAALILLLVAVLLDRSFPMPRTNANALDENQVKELDAIFGNRDETQLREYFGFPEMLEINIAMNAARKEHFLTTGIPDMDLTPFIGNRQMQFSSAYDTDSVLKAPGALHTRLDINSVSLLVLSENFSTHKADLLKFENSSRLPPSVTFAVKDFDRVLQENVDVMQNLLNDMMRQSPNYFLLNKDVSQSQYFKVIDWRYWGHFNQLRPLADQIRDSLRKSEGNN